MHVEQTGTGEAAVLIHSHGLSGRQWRRLAEELVAAGLRALAVDLTGQGRSEPWPEPEPFSFQHDVARVAELVRGAAPVHLVGHSYGGLIALHVALADPRAVRSLALYDPVAFGVLERAERAELDALDLTWDDRERWLRTFVEFWGGAGAWDALRDDARDEFRRVAWVVREGVRSLTEDRTPAEAYAQLAMPALLLTGERSPLPERRVVERLAQALPAARCEVIAGAGHLAPVTHAREVNRLIAGFVRAA